MTVETGNHPTAESAKKTGEQNKPQIVVGMDSMGNPEHIVILLSYSGIALLQAEYGENLARH
ncbi:hypothetical protein [Sulfitobacter maritimus]|uniref:hypothetical protein n=1 Tax=Sulfitobacter maritimus TaxID=2741719 RepID=UPI001FE9086B|nr:hypothetical protein [Sulfitobacter maritimus]